MRRRDELTLREAMRLLRLGPVADYFAHRWSDPTYLAGLALLEAHWNGPETAFELAGGIGHFARALGERGVACLSADIVFSKCWLAKNWVAPEADYVVFDAKDTWPLGEREFDLVHCQDAFYFLPGQDKVAARLRAATAPAGVLAVGHLHNSNVSGGAMGPARTAEEWGDLFPQARVYDERELRAAMMEARAPTPSRWIFDDAIEAWSVVEGGPAPRSLESGLALLTSRANLRPNPLLTGAEPAWPSERYKSEYAATATWTNGGAAEDPVRDRRLVDLPERW